MLWPVDVLEAFLIKGKNEYTNESNKYHIITDSQEQSHLISLTSNRSKGKDSRLLKSNLLCHSKNASIKLLVKYDDGTKDLIPLELFQPANVPNPPAHEDHIVRFSMWLCDRVPFKQKHNPAEQSPERSRIFMM